MLNEDPRAETMKRFDDAVADSYEQWLVKKAGGGFDHEATRCLKMEVLGRVWMIGDEIEVAIDCPSRGLCRGDLGTVERLQRSPAGLIVRLSGGGGDSIFLATGEYRLASKTAALAGI